MTIARTTVLRWIRVCFVLAIGVLLVSVSTDAGTQRRGGGGGGFQRGGGAPRVNTGAAATSIRSNQTVNRNVTQNRDFDRNINTNIDRDININRDIDVNANYDRWGHPVAWGVAAGAITAAAIGTTVAMLPSDCTTVVVDGIGYSQCGSTWYQPYYSGSTVEYTAVNPPQ